MICSGVVPNAGQRMKSRCNHVAGHQKEEKENYLGSLEKIDRLTNSLSSNSWTCSRAC